MQTILLHTLMALVVALASMFVSEAIARNAQHTRATRRKNPLIVAGLWIALAAMFLASWPGAILGVVGFVGFKSKCKLAAHRFWAPPDAAANYGDRGYNPLGTLSRIMLTTLPDTKHLLLKPDITNPATTVALCGAADEPLGYTKDKSVAAGDRLTVQCLGQGDETKVGVMDGAVAATPGKTLLITAASGKVQQRYGCDPGTYWEVGNAVHPAADGEEVEYNDCAPRKLYVAAPVLSSSTPADDATDVVVSANIVLNFDAIVQAGEGSIFIKLNSNDTAVEEFDIEDSDRVTISGKTVTIDPTNNLAGATAVYVEMASGVLTDRDGVAYPGLAKGDLNFTTA